MLRYFTVTTIVVGLIGNGLVLLASGAQKPRRSAAKDDDVTLDSVTRPRIQDRDQQQQDEFMEDLNWLRQESFGHGRNLVKMRSLGDTLHEKWGRPGKSANHHAALMLEFVRLLNPEISEPWREHYLELAIKHEEELSLSTQIKLFSLFKTPENVAREELTPDEWNRRRTSQMRSWFRTYQRVIADAASPPRWTNKVPHLGFYPPLPPKLTGVGLAVGAIVDPKFIEDPEARETYIQALVDYQLHGQKRREHQAAKEYEKTFLPAAEQYILWAYSVPPRNDQELHQFLEEFVSDADRRKRILERFVQK
jgi:hypothetical protein